MCVCVVFVVVVVVVVVCFAFDLCPLHEHSVKLVWIQTSEVFEAARAFCNFFVERDCRNAFPVTN